MKVPLPPFDARFVYAPTSEDARFFLTGGLKTPVRTPDGTLTCAYCDNKVKAVLVKTHVKGATDVRMVDDHICKQKVA